MKPVASLFRLGRQIKRHLIIGIALSILGLCATPITSWASGGSELPFNEPPQQSGGVLNALSAFGQKLGIGGNQDPFLPPDQAFIFSAEAINGNLISTRWDIEDGYYLYRDKFSFTLKDAPDIQLGTASLPKGKEKHDENFGLMEVYFHEITAQVPVIRQDKGVREITVIVGYQGCAEIGFCYPPMKKEVTLKLPEAGTASAPTPATGYVSDQDRYAQTLAEDNILLSMLTFFGLGILLTFTPCVFPMIPILSSIIAGQGREITTRRAFWLSLTYVLAMAATYTFAGVMAGMFGSNLQAAFQEPWILISFSILFMILALSMFGFYELQMPHRWQTKLTELSNQQQGGTFIGVAIMGLLSALIVGPCLAAPLAGALIYIGQTGDAFLGGSALFALSLGMGAPLLVIGTSAGKLLPKAGGWMNTIKAVFGVLLIGVAIWLLERIIPASISLVLWGTLLIVCAVYLGALENLQPEASGWHKLWKGIGLLLLIYGSMLLIGAASGAKDVFQPLEKLGIREASATNTPASHDALAFQQIKGLDGLQRAIDNANAQNKTVMLDFYADWCISCKEMEKFTFSDPGVQTALKDVVLLQADVTLNDAQDQALLNAFGLFGPPSILFFDKNGQELSNYRLVGFLDADRFETLVHTAFKK